MIEVRYKVNSLNPNEQDAVDIVPHRFLTLEELASNRRWQIAIVDGDRTYYATSWRDRKYRPANNARITFVAGYGGSRRQRAKIFGGQVATMIPFLLAAAFLPAVLFVAVMALAYAAFEGAIAAARWALRALVPGPPGLPDFGDGPSQGSASESSPTYGAGPVQTIDARGRVIPVVYGEVSCGGMRVNSFRRSDEDGNETLYEVLLLSHGPIESFGGYTSDQDDLGPADLPNGLEINGTKVSQFEEARVSWRKGTSGQTVMPGFEELTVGFDSDVELDATSTLDATTEMPVDSMEFHIAFPKGLHVFPGESGHFRPQTFEFRVTIFDAETDEEVASQNFEIRKNLTTQFSQTVRIDDLGYRFCRFVVERVSPIPPLYRQGGGSGFRPTGTDLAVASGYNEIQIGGHAYDGLSVLGLVIPQLQRLVSVDRRNYLIPLRGRLVDDGAWSNNPALVIRDFLTNKVFGLGHYFSDATFHDLGVEERADEEVPRYTGSSVMEKRYALNTVIDTQSGAWDIAQEMAKSCRSRLFRVGENAFLREDRGRPITQVFGDSQISREGVTIGYVSRDELPNEVEITFNSELRRYGTRSVIQRIPGINPSVDKVNKLSARSTMITSPFQAARHAAFLCRRGQLHRRQINFTVGNSALISNVGDVVAIATRDMGTNALASGRLVAQNESEIVLDEEVRFFPDVVYRYVEQSPDDEIRMNDFQVAEEVLTDTLPFGELDNTFPATKKTYAVGQTSRVIKPVMIERIRRAGHEGVVNIEASEFFPQVFTDETFSSVQSERVTPVREEPPDAVDDLSVVDEIYVSDGTSDVDISWTASAGADSYRIYYREPGGEEAGSGLQFVDRTQDTVYRLRVNRGSFFSIRIVVVAFSNDAGALPIPDSSFVDYTLQRDDFTGHVAIIPDDVDEFSLDLVDGNEYELSWVASDNATGYDLRAGGYMGGIEVWRGTSLSRTVLLGAARHRFLARAINFSNGRRNYSQGIAEIEADGVEIPSFGNNVVEVENENWETGEIQNAVIVPGLSGAPTLRQLSSAAPAQYATQIYDLGTSAPTVVSFYYRGWPFWGQTGHELSSRDPQASFMGRPSPGRNFGERFQQTRLHIEWSTNNTSWSTFAVPDWFGPGKTQFYWPRQGSAIPTARFYRLKLVFYVENEQDPGQSSVASLNNLSYVFSRGE